MAGGQHEGGGHLTTGAAQAAQQAARQAAAPDARQPALKRHADACLGYVIADAKAGLANVCANLLLVAISHWLSVSTTT